MNQKDRDRLARLYTLTSTWPWPNRNKTLGIGDLSKFFDAIVEIQRETLSCIMSISRCDVSDPDLDLDYLQDAIDRYRED